jgi:hypothetical protein
MLPFTPDGPTTSGAEHGGNESELGRVLRHCVRSGASLIEIAVKRHRVTGDWGLGIDHVTASFPSCFLRPCLTTQSSPTCSTRSRAERTSSRTERTKSLRNSRTDCTYPLRNAVRHPLRSDLEARHQYLLTGKDHHPVQLRVSLFFHCPATADSFNLVLPSNTGSASSGVDNGEDSAKGGDTARTGACCYTPYLPILTIGLRYVGHCAG